MDSESLLAFVTDHVFSAEDIESEYPMISSGVERGNIHSIYCSYYTTLGYRLEFIPITELRVFDEEFYIAIEEEANLNHAKRGDVGWYDSSGEQLHCLVEFERASKVPHKKAKHLVRYGKIHDNVELLILHYWDTDIRRDLDALERYFREGYETDSGAHISPPDADVLIVESVFNKNDNDMYSLTHSNIVESDT